MRDFFFLLKHYMPEFKYVQRQSGEKVKGGCGHGCGVSIIVTMNSYNAEK